MLICFLKEMLHLLISVLPSVIDAYVNHFFNHEFVYLSKASFCLLFLFFFFRASLCKPWKNSFLIILHVHYSANFPTCCSHFHILWMLLWKIWLVAQASVSVRYLSHLVVHVFVVHAYSFFKKDLPIFF